MKLTEEQLNERMLLIEKFQKWLDTNPSKGIIASQCATIAEDYAEIKVKQHIEMENKRLDELHCEYSGLPSVNSYKN